MSRMVGNRVSGMCAQPRGLCPGFNHASGQPDKAHGCARLVRASERNVETFSDVMNTAQAICAHVCTKSISYHPASLDVPLLEGVTMEIEPNTLGLVYGCSGGNPRFFMCWLVFLVRTQVHSRF